MRGQNNANNSDPSPIYIHPFLPDITRLLKSEFSGTVYEKLFAGNFVDRVQLYAHDDFPKDPIWDPLNVLKYPERHKNRSIYCTLVTSINTIHSLLKRDDYSETTRYYLTLYQDMMVPLINYIDTLCDKQKKQLELLSFIDKRSANVRSNEAVV